MPQNDRKIFIISLYKKSDIEKFVEYIFEMKTSLMFSITATK